MKRWMLVAVFATIVWQTGDLCGDIVIDRFTAGSPMVQFGAGTVSRTTVNGGILGGERDESLTVRDQGGAEVLGFLSYGPGRLAVGQSIADEIYGSLTYNNFSDIDFTAGGSQWLRLTFSSSDLANAEMTDVVTVTVVSGASSASVVTSVPANSGLPYSTLIDFNDFAGVDFTQVDSVELAFDMAGFPGNDFGIQFFGVTSIPEPSLAWLGLMTAGAWMLRRRGR